MTSADTKSVLYTAEQTANAIEKLAVAVERIAICFELFIELAKKDADNEAR